MGGKRIELRTVCVVRHGQTDELVKEHVTVGYCDQDGLQGALDALRLGIRKMEMDNGEHFATALIMVHGISDATILYPHWDRPMVVAMDADANVKAKFYEFRNLGRMVDALVY